MGRLRPVRGRAGGEDGTYAILFALLLIVFFAMAAMAVDVSTNVDARQDLHDTLDAAAHAGATLLPDDPEGAAAAALEYAQLNDVDFDGPLTVSFWCIVAEDDSGNASATQVTQTCPGVTYDTSAQRCDGSRCALPCDPDAGETCNTIQVTDAEDVPFVFGGVIGTPQGSTGLLASAACKGSCGEASTTTLDLVLVLDRTPSMRSVDIDALKEATEGLLEYLSPARHRVALVVHGAVRVGRDCPTAGVDRGVDSSDGYLDYWTSYLPRLFPGRAYSWLAVPFSDDYDPTDNSPPDDPPDLADTDDSDLVKGIDCLEESDHGTDLGDPVQAAAEYLDDFGRDGAQHVVMFMSDGEPTLPAGDGTLPSLQSDCNYARDRADAAKALGATVVTIAYRLQGVGAACADLSRATQLLAAMASDLPDGTATEDDGTGPSGLNGGGCNNTPEVDAENEDGDYFYCVPGPAQLREVLVQATSTVTGNIRLVRIPDDAS